MVDWFIRRGDWGARAATNATPFGAKRGVGVHWEGSHLGPFEHDVCAGHVRSIQADHMDGRNSDKKPWNDIAYNLVACNHGYVFEGRGVSFRSAANGTTAANADYGAVCFLGGQGDPMADAGYMAISRAIGIMQSGGFGSDIRGHRDFKPTTCPGDYIYARIRTLNSILQHPDPPKEVMMSLAIEPIGSTTREQGGGWGFGRGGAVYAFDGAPYFGGWRPEDAGPTNGSGRDCVALVPSKTGQGYWLVSDSGEVYAYGDATYPGNYEAEWGPGFVIFAFRNDKIETTGGLTLVRQDLATYHLPK